MFTRCEECFRSISKKFRRSLRPLPQPCNISLGITKRESENFCINFARVNIVLDCACSCAGNCRSAEKFPSKRISTTYIHQHQENVHLPKHWMFATINCAWKNHSNCLLYKPYFVFEKFFFFTNLSLVCDIYENWRYYSTSFLPWLSQTISNHGDSF